MMNRSICRLCAALLALVMLASAAGLAEAVDDLEIGMDAGAPELPGTIGGIEGDAAVDFDGVIIDGAPGDLSLELPETLLASQASQEDEPEADEASIPGEIELGVGEKYVLKPEEAPEGVLTYRSTKPTVAAVDEKGVIVGLAPGKARIKCYRDKALLGVCLVRVIKAPSEVSLNFSSITIGARETVQLEAKVDKGARAAFTWSSRDEKIVQVTQDGLIEGRTPGKTFVTVRTFNGRKARLIVRVARAPKTIALNYKSVIIAKGKSFQLKVDLPDQTASHQITWRSSNEAVVAVDDQGMFTALSKGEAEITARTFNGSEATCSVTVTGDSDDEDSDVTYRALLIGQTDFSEHMESPRSDVIRLTKALRTVRGLHGGSWQTTWVCNLDRSEVLQAIRQAFAGAQDDDVSLFFISTHGVSDPRASDDMAGALTMIPEGSELLTMGDLANALREIPGKIIILINACGSGAGVYTEDERNAASAKGQAAARRFDQCVVDAFSQADPGIVIKAHDASGVTQANTGELRVENKFYVLTAARYQENSYGYNGIDNYSLFAKWLSDGIGLHGKMKADANKNGQVSLNEMYKYIVKVGNRFPVVDREGHTHYQHVQVYPSNSSFVMFTR